LKRLFIFCIFSALISPVIGQELTLSGVYRGKDIYVQNPFTNIEGAFCITFIMVNGEKIIEDPATSAVKIDLSVLAINAPVSIEIHHNGGCLPKILNPNVLNAGSAFKYIQIMADDASITWVTTGEMPGEGKYVLEKMKLNGWEPIATTLGKGNLDNNQYSLGVDHYAGENRFRLKYQYKEEVVISDDFDFYSDLESITYYPDDKIYDIISLSRPTDYVITGDNDVVLLKGEGQDIIVEALPYGELTLIIENRQETIFRPEPEIIDRPKKKKGKKN